MMDHGKSAKGQGKLKVSLQLQSKNNEMELASNIFRGSVLLSGDSCSPQSARSARDLTRIASGAIVLPSPRAPKTPRGKTPRGRTPRSKILSRQMARLITSEKFVMISGTDKRITEGNHVSAEGFGAVSSKYALHAVDDNDDSGPYLRSEFLPTSYTSLVPSHYVFLSLSCRVLRPFSLLRFRLPLFLLSV